MCYKLHQQKIERFSQTNFEYVEIYFDLKPVWPNITFDQYLIHFQCSHVWLTWLSFIHFKISASKYYVSFHSCFILTNLVLLSPRGSYTWSDAYDNCKANKGYLASVISYDATVKSSSAWIGKVELISKWLQIMGKVLKNMQIIYVAL